MDEGAVSADGDLVSLFGRDFDEIAEHVVVLDLQRLNAGLFRIAALQPGNQPPAFVTELAELIQFRGVALGDKPAVTGVKGQFVIQGAFKPAYQFIVAAEAPLGVGDSFGRPSCAGFKHLLNLRRRFQSLPHRRQVPRAAAAEGQPGKGAFDVGRTPKDIPQVF